MPNSNTSTPLQALPTPVSSALPDITSDMYALAVAVEKKLVMVYTSNADRDAKVTTPVAGMFCITLDAMKIWIYSGASWSSIPTSFPNITAGTAAPSGGNDGDFYFKY